MRKLSLLLPTVRWVPHDIEPPSSSKKDKDKPKHSILSKKISQNYGSLRRRKSVVSVTSVMNEEPDARTHMQGQSPFFAMLPIEIRKMVYEYVVGKETVHLVIAKKRFGHFICEGDEDGEGHGECGCKVLVGGARCGRLSGACTRMLVVCRRMYTEAVPHLYSPHRFSILHITHLLYLPGHVTQLRLDTIRTLRLRWAIRGLPYFRRNTAKRLTYPEDTANWKKGWDILSRMKGLKDLKVVIVDPSPEGIWEAHWLVMEEALLDPARSVRVAWLFEITLPYAGCRVDWDMGESKARLVRPVIEGNDQE